MALLAVMNVIQIVIIPLHWLGHKRLVARVNTLMAGVIFTLFVTTMEYLSGIRIIIDLMDIGLKIEFSGDKIPVHESAFIITNHVSALDIILIMALALRKGMVGNLIVCALKQTFNTSSTWQRNRFNISQS
jgi:1-acyl-sn-glycerol-3-phosphate acyltransferase